MPEVLCYGVLIVVMKVWDNNVCTFLGESTRIHEWGGVWSTGYNRLSLISLKEARFWSLSKMLSR